MRHQQEYPPLVGERPGIELEPPAVSKAVNRPAPRAPLRRPVPSRTEPKKSLGERILNSLGPLSLSLLVHALLLILLSLITWAVGTGTYGIPGDFTAQLVHADRSGPQGGFNFAGDADVDRPDSSDASERIRDLASLLAEEGSVQMSAVDLGNAGLRDVPVESLQRGDVVGTQLFGGGQGGDSGSGLGEGSAAGGGPVGSLWGVGAGQRADSVVYVMDRSGSMMDSIAMLKTELKKSIGELSEDQRFNVLWFAERKPEMWAPTPRKATIENKRDAFEAIDNVSPEGRTNPIPAIQQGLSFKPAPDVMFLLSDGDFDQQNDEVLKAIRAKNRSKQTIINTILFLEDYREASGQEIVLERIARENRGTYKHVTIDDIRARRY